LKAFILAGGFGTRMFPLSVFVPKCLVYLGGKPFVRYSVEHLRPYCDRVYVLTEGWMVEPFRHEFRGDGEVEVVGFEEEYNTAGKLLAVRDLVGGTSILCYGDTFIPVDVEDVLKFHSKSELVLGEVLKFRMKKEFALTLVLTTSVPIDYGIVMVDGDRVSSFAEKPELEYMAWTGMGVFEPSFLDYVEGYGEDVARDVIPRLVAEERVGGYVTDKPFLDVGSLPAYKRALKLLPRIARGEL